MYSGEGKGNLEIAVEPRVVRAGGRERIHLVSIGLHEPEQHSCVVEVVSILLSTAGASR